MAGITRIEITDKIDSRGGWRFEWSRKRWPAANELYREVFPHLLPGEEVLKCTKTEFEAGYDYALGIDVMLGFEGGISATLQEKFLRWHESTVTVEYMQDWRRQVEGDWFNLKAQYYFVGYDRNDSRTFQDWILLNWPTMMQATARGAIDWRERQNKKDGARASLKWAYFDQFPNECIVARCDLSRDPAPEGWD
jgi:hypothetical protein